MTRGQGIQDRGTGLGCSLEGCLHITYYTGSAWYRLGFLNSSWAYMVGSWQVPDVVCHFSVSSLWSSISRHPARMTEDAHFLLCMLVILKWTRWNQQTKLTNRWLSWYLRLRTCRYVFRIFRTSWSTRSMSRSCLCTTCAWAIHAHARNFSQLYGNNQDSFEKKREGDQGSS